jgi:hypothetical protein
MKKKVDRSPFWVNMEHEKEALRLLQFNNIDFKRIPTKEGLVLGSIAFTSIFWIIILIIATT